MAGKATDSNSVLVKDIQIVRKTAVDVFDTFVGRRMIARPNRNETTTIQGLREKVLFGGVRIVTSLGSNKLYDD